MPSSTKGESIPGRGCHGGRKGHRLGQGGLLGEAKCGIPGNRAQVLDSSHKDPKLRCPLSGPAGFGPAFSLVEEPGARGMRTRRSQRRGWPGPGDPSGMHAGVREMVGTGKRLSRGMGGQGLRGGLGGLPPPPPLGWLQAGALGPAGPPALPHAPAKNTSGPKSALCGPPAACSGPGLWGSRPAGGQEGDSQSLSPRGETGAAGRGGEQSGSESRISCLA